MTIIWTFRNFASINLVFKNWLCNQLPSVSTAIVFPLFFSLNVKFSKTEWIFFYTVDNYFDGVVYTVSYFDNKILQKMWMKISGLKILIYLVNKIISNYFSIDLLNPSLWQLIIQESIITIPSVNVNCILCDFILHISTNFTSIIIKMLTCI